MISRFVCLFSQSLTRSQSSDDEENAGVYHESTEETHDGRPNEGCECCAEDQRDHLPPRHRDVCSDLHYCRLRVHNVVHHSEKVKLKLENRRMTCLIWPQILFLTALQKKRASLYTSVLHCSNGHRTRCLAEIERLESSLLKHIRHLSPHSNFWFLTHQEHGSMYICK